VIEILAQNVVSDLTIGGSCLTIGGLGVWIYQHLKNLKNVRANALIKIRLGEEDAAKEAQGHPVPTVCPAHESFVKLLDERNTSLRGELSEIKAAVSGGRKETNASFRTIHGRMDEVLATLAGKHQEQ